MRSELVFAKGFTNDSGFGSHLRGFRRLIAARGTLFCHCLPFCVKSVWLEPLNGVSRGDIGLHVFFCKQTLKFAHIDIFGNVRVCLPFSTHVVAQTLRDVVYLAMCALRFLQHVLTLCVDARSFHSAHPL